MFALETVPRDAKFNLRPSFFHSERPEALHKINNRALSGGKLVRHFSRVRNPSGRHAVRSVYFSDGAIKIYEPLDAFRADAPFLFIYFIGLAEPLLPLLRVRKRATRRQVRTEMIFPHGPSQKDLSVRRSQRVIGPLPSIPSRFRVCCAWRLGRRTFSPCEDNRWFERIVRRLQTD